MKAYSEMIFREGCKALDGEFSGEGGRYPSDEAVNMIANIYGVSKDTIISDIRSAKESEEVWLKCVGSPKYSKRPTYI